MTAIPKPLVLMILDGFGHSESPESNAIMAANTPVWDRLWEWMWACRMGRWAIPKWGT